MIVIKAVLRFTFLDSLRISSIDLIISDFFVISPPLSPSSGRAEWLSDAT